MSVKKHVTSSSYIPNKIDDKAKGDNIVWRFSGFGDRVVEEIVA